MKQTLLVLALTLAGSGFAQPQVQLSSLADARAKIETVVAEPEKMVATMKQLSPADQLQFVADVNAAIAKLPGSNEEKTAIFLNVNRAALRGAAKGNLAAVVAEIFATVPVESLTVLHERFAADVFNRSANPKVSYTDEQFKQIAAKVMEKVNARVASADNSDVRSCFAALMMIRASNSKAPEMVDAIVAMLPAATQATAKSEWVPAALSDSPSYEPMLGMADAGEQPNVELVILIAGAQNYEALLGDLSGMSLDPTSIVGRQTPIIDAVQNAFKDPVPRLVAGGVDAHPAEGKTESKAEEKQPDEPGGYQWQER